MKLLWKSLSDEDVQLTVTVLMIVLAIFIPLIVGFPVDDDTVRWLP